MCWRSDVSIDPEQLELWFLPDRSRFFLVPRGVRLPAGGQLLHGLPLRRRQVAAEALETWEVSQEHARTHVDQRVVGAMGGMRRAVEDLLGLEEEGAEVTPPEEELRDRAREFLGVSAGDVVLEPGRARDGLRSVLDKLGQAARDAAPDAEERAALRERLKEVEHDLLDPEGTIGRGVATVEDQMDAALPAIGAGLEQLAEGIRDAAQRLRDEAAEE